MGEVIYGRFSSEKAWQQSHQRLTETLLVVGELFGDKDQVLLRAKADLAHAMIREIVEEVPVPTLPSTFQIASPRSNATTLGIFRTTPYRGASR
jgi:hypothetical protein